MATWRVNSYGYPNPFMPSQSAEKAWEMFVSFTKFNSYRGLKKHWESHPKRPVDSHAVESWKANFEECGIIYVLSGDDGIHITAGGRQLLAAAKANDDREFAWIGLNLLLRYPLRGNGRRSRGAEHNESDLLLYWFVLATLLELKGFWHSELFRVLSAVFARDQAPKALEVVRGLRSRKVEISNYLDPSGGHSGAVYNAINQVMVKGSLNHMLFTSDRRDSIFIGGESENFWHVREEFRDVVELALGGQAQQLPPGCGAGATLIQRLPGAPKFANEQSYFDYAGAPVQDLRIAISQTHSEPAPAVQYGTDVVYLLTATTHFQRLDASRIVGPVHVLCVLAIGQRVLVDDELAFTYMVEDKVMDPTGQVTVMLRRARPIHDHDYVLALFKEA
jgi:hypothetical protein